MQERSGYLSNGMRWLIDGVEAPVVAIYLWIDVGSRDEPEGMYGAAHALEHMVFKGTAPPEGAGGAVGAGYGVGGVAAAVEGAGGDINAWTSYDETVYHLTVPPEEMGMGLSVLAQMVRYAILDAGEFKREKEVICEEIRGGEEEPDQVLGEALYAGLFPGHAYGRPIAGTPAGVKRIEAGALRAFYERFYQPSNCCIALSGPVGRTEAEAAEVVAGLEARFGGGGPRPEREVRVPEAAAGSLTVRRDFPGEWREIAFPGPGHRHPDTAALELLGEMIGGSASAPMEGLRRELHLCQSVSARYEAEQAAGVFTVYLQTAPGEGVAAQRAAGVLLGALVDGVAEGLAGLSQADLERAQAQLLAERAFSRETVDGRAHSMVFQDRVMGDPGAWRIYDAAIAGMQLSDVQAVARRYLRPERSLQVFLAPKPGKPLPLVYGEDAAVRGLLPRRRAGGAGAVERWRLGNGLEVLLEPAESEVVGVRVAGAGGQIAGLTAGWTELWSRLVLREPGGMEAQRFAAEVERLGASMGATTGRSTQGMALDVPAWGLDMALELLALGLTDPTFPADGLDVVRGEQDRAREEDEDYPETVMERACWEMAFLKHPWGKHPRGTAAGLARATPAGMMRLHRRWARAENLTVSIAGGFDPERVKERLGRLLGRLPGGRAEIRLPEAPTRGAGGERLWSMEAGQGQAQLAMVFPGCASADPARPLLQPALSTVATVLGGQGGRLFLELRERLGLAYDVGASSEEGLAPGLLICSLGIDPARMGEAEAALRRCVADLVESGVPAEELQRAIRSQVGAGASDLQTMAGRARAAAYTAVYGEDGTQYRRLMRRVEQVDDTALRGALDMLRHPVGVVQVMPRA